MMEKIKKQSGNPEVNKMYQLFLYVDRLTKCILHLEKNYDI